MTYISGYYALNIPCSLDTTGDWHQSCLAWDKVELSDSQNSPLGEWGIEKDVYVYPLNGYYNVANHIRACLDFLDTDMFSHASGMREDYIANDKYNNVIFEQVYKLKPAKTDEQWQKISKTMEKDYKLQWLHFISERGEKTFIIDEDSSTDDQKEKLECMHIFLQYLNKYSGNYVLKGGTALMLHYGLPRFSEDIDLDSNDPNSICYIADNFCKQYGFISNIKKEADFALHIMIRYSESHDPLIVNISLRYSDIPSSAYKIDNNVKVYNIDVLAALKIATYGVRDKLRDLFDCSFIINNYYDELSFHTINSCISTFQHKGLEQLDYLIATQKDPLIDIDSLKESYLKACDRLGLREIATIIHEITGIS